MLHTVTTINRSRPGCFHSGFFILALLTIPFFDLILLNSICYVMHFVKLDTLCTSLSGSQLFKQCVCCYAVALWYLNIVDSSPCGDVNSFYWQFDFVNDQWLRLQLANVFHGRCRAEATKWTGQRSARWGEPISMKYHHRQDWKDRKEIRNPPPSGLMKGVVVRIAICYK